MRDQGIFGGTRRGYLGAAGGVLTALGFVGPASARGGEKPADRGWESYAPATDAGAPLAVASGRPSNQSEAPEQPMLIVGLGEDERYQVDSSDPQGGVRHCEVQGGANPCQLWVHPGKLTLRIVRTALRHPGAPPEAPQERSVTLPIGASSVQLSHADPTAGYVGLAILGVGVLGLGAAAVVWALPPATPGGGFHTDSFNSNPLIAAAIAILASPFVVIGGLVTAVGFADSGLHVDVM